MSNKRRRRRSPRLPEEAVQVEIESLSAEGRGIAHVDDRSPGLEDAQGDGPPLQHLPRAQQDPLLRSLDVDLQQVDTRDFPPLAVRVQGVDLDWLLALQLDQLAIHTPLRMQGSVCEGTPSRIIPLV